MPLFDDIDAMFTSFQLEALMIAVLLHRLQAISMVECAKWQTAIINYGSDL